jgi:hypothetical protein
VNVPNKAAMWARINELLVEHERAQSDAVRLALAESWDALRQRLTVVALTEGEPANGGETT